MASAAWSARADRSATSSGRKRPGAPREDVERADRAAVGVEWDADKSSIAPREGGLLVGRIVAGVGGQILDDDGLAPRHDQGR
jgi:hypothetical protein